MNHWWHAAADLLLGACCPRCRAPGVGVCRACAVDLAPEPVRLTVGDLPAVAAGRHEGERREALLAWKVGGAVAYDRLMAHHLAVAVVGLVADGDRVTLAPVPSSRRSRRQRGRDLVADLAVGAASMLSAIGLDATVDRGLRLVRQPRDQHALGREERARNVAGSMRSGGRVQAPVVVVDDVLTTGSTLLEAVRAIDSEQPGAVVGGAVLVAAESGAPAVATHPIHRLRSN